MSQEASKLQLFDPPEGSVQQVIEGKASNEDEAKKLIQAWMSQA